MTAEKLTHTTYTDPDSGLPRSGNTARGESRVDLEEYTRPLERVHAGHAHGRGVAEGLRVTAVLGETSVRVLPGVALDAEGRHISLAPGGLARTDGGSPVDVGAEGLVLATGTISGARHLTIAFAETFDAKAFSDSEFTVFQFDHTPRLALPPVEGFDGDGVQVVLATVVFDDDGNVTELNQQGRRAVSAPVERVGLHRAVRRPDGEGVAVDHQRTAEVRARPEGGMELRVDQPGDEIDLGRDGGAFARLSIGAETIVAVRDDGTQTLTFDATSGNLGLGAGTAPRTALHVPERGLQIGTSSSAGDNFHWVSDIVAGQRGLRLYRGNHGDGTHVLTCRSDGGRVGIGVADPEARLHVQAARSEAAVHGITGANTGAVRGRNTGEGPGVSGSATSGTGVTGSSESGRGVCGQSGTGAGVVAVSNEGTALVAMGAEGGAGHFVGDVFVQGTLRKNGGQFVIDHPLDPANRYLNHAFVESAEMKNLYDGVVELDEDGGAEVVLEDWCEALNQDFRYQLTPIGGPAPDLHVARELSGNRFAIGGGSPGLRVSWQLTGVRHDPYALANPLTVDEEKPEPERGFYLSPDLYDQPAERGIAWAREPRQMRLLNVQRRRLRLNAERRRAAEQD